MPKIKTSKSGLAKNKGFKFKWWMGVVIIAVIAVVGIVVLRLSHASTAYTDYVTSTYTYALPTHDIAVNLRNTGHWDCYNGNCQQLIGSIRKCANISYQGYVNYNLSKAYLPVGSGVTVSETGSGTAASYSCPSFK